jgi:tol-pal system protein YbgF
MFFPLTIMGAIDGQREFPSRITWVFKRPIRTPHIFGVIMKLLALIICIGLLGATGCALQQDIVILDDRVATLEAQNQELQQRLQGELAALGKNRQGSEKTLRGQYASMKVSVESLQQELRLINGRVEEIEYMLNRKLAQYEQDGKQRQQGLDEANISLGKIDKRITQLEQYLSLERKEAKPVAQLPVPDGQSAVSDKQLYDKARQAFDNGQMDKARQGFIKLIAIYPKSGYADNAQFWIGESYYRENWFERAILEYQTVVEKYPKGNKVPAAMHKQGMSFLKIGDKSNARIVFNELVQKYPETNEGKIAAKKLKEF